MVRLGTEPAPALRPEADPEAGPILLHLARTAILARGADGHVDDPAWLAGPGATFVTLTRQGRLRGCIGSVEAQRSIRDDVVHNACAGAFHDPRFPPVAATEVPALRIEVSLLSPLEKLPSRTRDELLCAVRPHADGLVLSWHGHRGTFLPQVWEKLPDAGDFVEHLLHKAGLPVSFWAADVVARRFSATSWAEPEPSRELVHP